MTTFYLVRHGENPANLTKEFSYRLVDYSLTERGVRQAEATARALQHLPIAAVYSSPLKRACETAQIIAQAPGLPVEVMEQFREVNVGTLEHEPPTAASWTLHNQILSDWYAANHTATFPGGENYVMLLERMLAGLAILIERHPDQQIVVVGHGGIFTAPLKDICTDVDAAYVLKHPNANCSITQIKCDPGFPQRKAQLIRLVAANHLSAELRESFGDDVPHFRDALQRHAASPTSGVAPLDGKSSAE